MLIWIIYDPWTMLVWPGVESGSLRSLINPRSEIKGWAARSENGIYFLTCWILYGVESGVYFELNYFFINRKYEYRSGSINIMLFLCEVIFLVVLIGSCSMFVILSNRKSLCMKSWEKNIFISRVSGYREILIYNVNINKI